MRAATLGYEAMLTVDPPETAYGAKSSTKKCQRVDERATRKTETAHHAIRMRAATLGYEAMLTVEPSETVYGAKSYTQKNVNGWTSEPRVKRKRRLMQ
jgi:hypothetical protein